VFLLFWIDALRVSPETEKAQPISPMSRIVVCGDNKKAASFIGLIDGLHLLSGGAHANGDSRF
jgi:hypothetical protein